MPPIPRVRASNLRPLSDIAIHVPAHVLPGRRDDQRLTRFDAMPTHPLCMRALALFVLVGVVSCRRPEEASAAPAMSGEAPEHVQTAVVTQRPMPRYLTLTGTLRARSESDLAADASGKVVQTWVERGQPVKRGQVIATLDSRASALAATAADAQAKLAQSQLEQARRDCERAKHLLETGAISQAEYDRQTAACTAQQWSAVAAEAQGKSATKMLGDTSIRAPFDGIIGERYVNVGQYLLPSTRVASIYAPDPLRLELTVPEANVAAVKPDMVVSFNVIAFGDESFTGRVRYISPNIREATRDLVIEAVVPNSDGRVKPGMFAVAKVLLDTPPTAVVPSAALVRDDAGARVFVVVGHEVQERLVQLGETVGDVVAVASGVKPGDIVVLRPGANVHDGTHVET
jgi:membrane fusion protein (multidrug efflux system)